MTKTLQWSSEVEIRAGSLLTGKGYKSNGSILFYTHTHTHTYIYTYIYIYIGCGDNYIGAQFFKIHSLYT